jgi:hypothetical protein
MKLTRTIAVCSVVLALSACSALFSPNYALRLGVLEPPAAPLVTVPDTVAASTDFDVSVRTSGGGCNDIGTTDVTMVDDRTAEVRPWDYAQVNAKICTAIYKIFNHHATLRFAKTGIATVRVIGQSGDSTVTIARIVVVR